MVLAVERCQTVRLSRQHNPRLSGERGSASRLPLYIRGLSRRSRQDGWWAGRRVVESEVKQNHMKHASRARLARREAQINTRSMRRFDPADPHAEALFDAIEAGSVAAMDAALSMAVESGRERRELLQVRCRGNRCMALHWATHRCRNKSTTADVIKKLIAEGANVNEWAGNAIRQVPLHYTVGAGDVSSTRALLDAGANAMLPFEDDVGRLKDCYELAAGSKLPAREPNGHTLVCALLAERFPALRPAASSKDAESAPKKQKTDAAPAGSASTSTSAARSVSRREDLALQMLEGLDKSLILEMGNGLGGGHRVRAGCAFLTAYAAALQVSRASLVAALKAAPGELEYWAEAMSEKELRELGYQA